MGAEVWQEHQTLFRLAFSKRYYNKEISKYYKKNGVTLGGYLFFVRHISGLCLGAIPKDIQVFGIREGAVAFVGRGGKDAGGLKAGDGGGDGVIA